MDFNTEEIDRCLIKITQLRTLIQIRDLGYDYSDFSGLYLTDYDPDGWYDIDYFDFLECSIGSSLGNGDIKKASDEVGEDCEDYPGSIYEKLNLKMPRDIYDDDNVCGIIIRVDNYDINTCIKHKLLDSKFDYLITKELAMAVMSESSGDEVQFALDEEKNELYIVIAGMYIDGVHFMANWLEILKYLRVKVTEFHLKGRNNNERKVI